MVLWFQATVIGWFASGCEGGPVGDFASDTTLMPLSAYCEVYLPGIGLIDVETDYLPHVVQCENGAADFEALRAQAVAARSYLYYKLDQGEEIEDGTGDQVYSCGRTPLPDHLDAVEETAGQVMVFDDVTVCGFYVAGAIPSSENCIPLEGDPDLFNTERFVTYNWGLFGEDVIQSSLGYVHPDNPFNRGCKSQNGAHCLSENGWDYLDILKFYYGMDIRLERGEGICVSDSDSTEGDTETDTESDTDSLTWLDTDTDSEGSSTEDAELDSLGGCRFVARSSEEGRKSFFAVILAGIRI